MSRYKDILKRLLLILLLTVMLCSLNGQALIAGDSGPKWHEDPESVTPVFIPYWLLAYYLDSLDFIINLDKLSSLTNLEQLQYARIPPELAEAAKGFREGGTGLTDSFIDLYKLWEKARGLVAERKFSEAYAVYRQMLAGLPQARSDVTEVKAAVIASGLYLNIDKLSGSNPLRAEYERVMEKISLIEELHEMMEKPLVDLEKIKEMVNLIEPGLLEQITALLNLPPEELEKALQNLNPEIILQLLKNTDLTLEIEPDTAFVGDEVNFRGRLTCEGQPLAGREIKIMLDRETAASATTNGSGEFRGTLRLPYSYRPTAEAQAFYFPSGNDVVRYLESSSPVVTINVLYYEANLTLHQEGAAYPGRDAVLVGEFDYGSAPVPPERQVTVYIDSTEAGEFASGGTFRTAVSVDSNILPGKHTVTALAAASGRYAPVTGTCTLDVKLAVPVLTLNMPGIGLLPGPLGFSGSLTSEVGPLSGAVVKVSSGKDQVELSTAKDGTFSGKLGLGMSPDLIGTQPVRLEIRPAEPWNAPLTVTRNVFMINWVTCGLLLVLMLALAYLIPRLMKRWHVAAHRKPEPGVVFPKPSAVPVPVEAQVEQVKAGKTEEEAATNPVVYWYHRVIQFIQEMTRRIRRPQETLREYAREVSRLLGPLSEYFYELTLLVEKRLYSGRPPEKEDVEKSRSRAEEILRWKG